MNQYRLTSLNLYSYGGDNTLKATATFSGYDNEIKLVLPQELSTRVVEICFEEIIRATQKLANETLSLSNAEQVTAIAYKTSKEDEET